MLVASVRSNVSKFRGVLAGAVVLGAVLLPSSQANAVSASVRFACAGDYSRPLQLVLAQQCRDPDAACGRSASRLSKGCISALVVAGEVSKTKSHAARPASTEDRSYRLEPAND